MSGQPRVMLQLLHERVVVKGNQAAEASMRETVFDVWTWAINAASPCCLSG